MNTHQFISIVLLIVLGFSIAYYKIEKNGSQVYDQAKYDYSISLSKAVNDWAREGTGGKLIFGTYLQNNVVLNPNHTWEYSTTSKNL